MTQRVQPIDAGGRQDVSHPVEEVSQIGQSKLIQADDEAGPRSPDWRASQARTGRHAFTRDDALFGLIGIGTGKTPGGVSSKKHEALAHAYRPK